MDIRIAGTVDDSIVDGPGFRYTVFAQGCPHHCPGCHNPETHDFAGGRAVDSGCHRGADAGQSPAGRADPLRGRPHGAARSPARSWPEQAHGPGPERMVLHRLHPGAAAPGGRPGPHGPAPEQTDVLVDGPFLLAQRSLELKYCGSRNQRLIDVKKTLSSGVPTLWEPPVW